MRIYSPEQEEKIHLLRQARRWRFSGLISKEQLRAIDLQNEIQLKQVNPFLRLLFFIFTSLGLWALFDLVIIFSQSGPSSEFGVEFLPLGLASYFMAEYLVKKYNWYRYGVEEALSLYAAEILVVGISLLMSVFYPSHYSWEITFISGILSLLLFTWLYSRFGFLYAALFAFLSIASLPYQLHLPVPLLGVIVFVLSGICLSINVSLDKKSVQEFRKSNNAILQAFLFLCMYLATLLPCGGMMVVPWSVFYLSFLLFCLLPIMALFYGIRERKRWFINVGVITALFTIIGLKGYLQLPYYTWDLALLGLSLMLLAITIIYWLSQGENKSRFGFTAENILKPELYGINLAVLVASIGLQNAASVSSPDSFSDGKSGGGGAGRSFS